MKSSSAGASLAWGAGTTSLVVLAGSALVASQRESLPSRIAVHWAGQDVTGTSTVLSHLVVTGATVAVVGGLLTLLARHLGSAPRAALTGLAVGCALFLGGTGYGLALGQRGLADPLHAENPAAAVVGSALVAGAVAMIAVKAVAALNGSAAPVQPHRALPASAVRLSDDADGQVAWRALSPSGVGTVLGVSLVVLVPLTLLALVVRDWWILALGVLLGTFLASMCVTVVTVDVDGVTVKGFGFVPWLHVPVARIAYADVENARPRGILGVGLRRRADGTVTFLTKAGPALRLHGLSGPDVWLSIPDAHTAAATANSLIDHEVTAARAAA